MFSHNEDTVNFIENVGSQILHLQGMSRSSPIFWAQVNCEISSATAPQRAFSIIICTDIFHIVMAL